MNLELRIEKLVFGGSGLGFAGGKAVFVEGALPEEKVLVKITNEKHNYSKARLVKVLEASPARMEPPCPYIHACGGCQYQHVTYPQELRWKEEQVRESFTQALKTDPALVARIRSGAKEYGYRTSITLHRTREENNKTQRLAFVGRDNRSLVPIENCLLADPGLKNVFTALHKLDRNEIKRAFRVDEDGSVISSEGNKLCRMRLGEGSFWAHSRGFFQNNLEVTELIGKELAGLVTEAKPGRFVDLYAGVGTFSILSAAQVPELCCFEESPYAVDCLKRNLKERNRNAAIFKGKVEQTFPNFWLGNKKEGSFVFLDPPRLGIAASLAEFFSKADGIGDLVYLACDLQILIRDLRTILSNGRYRIQSVIPFDMFPRTKHIEILTRLQKI